MSNKLDNIAAQVARADSLIGAAGPCFAFATGSDADKGRRAIAEAEKATTAALNALASLGAVARPGGVAVPDTVPAHLRDTPAMRRMVVVLEALAQAAEAVDRERGDVDSETGQCTGYAEQWRAQADRLTAETFGPMGLGDWDSSETGQAHP